MRVQFQSPFDSTAYQLAKAKGRESKEKGANNKQTTSSRKPIHTTRDAAKSTTRTSGTVSLTVGEEYQPTRTLWPIDVYDLTADEEALASLPRSALQQATPQQVAQAQVAQENAIQDEMVTQDQAIQGQVTQEKVATQEIESGNYQDRETFAHETSAEHSREDLTQQGRSPKDSGSLANGADTSGRDNGRESVNGLSAYALVPSAQSPNDVAVLPTNTAPNMVPTCWENCSEHAAGLSRCSNGSSHGVLELEPNRPSNLCEQVADSHKPASSDGGMHPELPMNDAEGDGMSDEWEGKIIGEEAGEYLVAWKNSLIPKEYASAAMVQAWEGKKAKILAGEGMRGVGTEGKQLATINGRVDKRRTAPAKRGRGRPRVKHSL